MLDNEVRLDVEPLGDRAGGVAEMGGGSIEAVFAGDDGRDGASVPAECDAGVLEVGELYERSERAGSCYMLSTPPRRL